MKIAYIDTETTGLSPEKHGIVQLACLIVEDHKIIDEIDILLDPFSYKENCACDDKALEINGRTIEEIEHFPNADDQLEKFLDFLSPYTQEANTLQIAGYNVDFDIKFIKDWFKLSDTTFGDYFNHETLDVLSLVRHAEYFRAIKLERHRLINVCEHYNIFLDAHNALNDIKATLKVHRRLKIELSMWSEDNFQNIISVSLFGYGFEINYIGHNSENGENKDKYELFGGWGKRLNPYITFGINYRLITFVLLLNRK
ncbi:putative enzyme, similar to DNA-directed DNA polymerase PolC and exonuclease RNase T [Sulfurovum sp. enrichment culture clone C5]|uniref:Putative enzyme, similar to DNA-directed DNA polymerase PolC and exonuclease RNase T n=1 Tax=Sulfurovum sp. enrichment culture clone C5 TaxID=497650 RepID=A0A0S4XMJ5_9BACT|nr:putative enzyme, similar to DNA-directed DNA polymerase PolC and exonuclease RNase T [Sulfurovum sp. enrichment culture clone C5]